MRIDGARALVSFRRTLPDVIPNASSSCGSIGLLAQLDRTATQFAGIEEAWYSLEGDRAALYGCQLRPGQIVLMHVGSHPTDGLTLDADALPEVIRRIRAAGYGFTDLDALLGGS